LLTGETPDQDRKRILESFKTQHKGILVVTTVGDEGIDIPDANVGIIVSGTGSRRQFIQRLGRLLRPKSSGQRAVLYEIVVKHTVEEIWASRRTQDVDQQ
ncbi:MAG: helicase-related protein, partial [Desulfurococcaceae archaeon]